jgi:hypothetical protein
MANTTHFESMTMRATDNERCTVLIFAKHCCSAMASPQSSSKNKNDETASSRESVLYVAWRSFNAVLFDVPMTEVPSCSLHSGSAIQPTSECSGHHKRLCFSRSRASDITLFCATQCLSLHKALAACHVPHPPTLEHWIIPGLKGATSLTPLRITGPDTTTKSALSQQDSPLAPTFA